MSLQLLVPTFRDSPRPYAKDINRLISSWWPTGKILGQDDMEALIADATNHYKQTFGTIARSSEKAFHGQYSLKLTTGNVAGNTGGAGNYISIPRYGRVGLELKWLTNASDDLRNMRAFIVWYDGVNAHHCDIRYYNYIANVENKKWQYLNSLNALTNIFNQKVYLAPTEPAWNGIKLIADFEKDTYDSFYSNDLSRDMKGIPLYVAPSTVTSPLLGIYLQVTTDENKAISMWFDDVILTDEGD